MRTVKEREEKSDSHALHISRCKPIQCAVKRLIIDWDQLRSFAIDALLHQIDHVTRDQQIWRALLGIILVLSHSSSHIQDIAKPFSRQKSCLCPAFSEEGIGRDRAPVNDDLRLLQ